MALQRTRFVQRLSSSPRRISPESCTSTIGLITLDVKQTGKPSARNGHARFDAAGTENQLTIRLVRHSQRKRGATDRSHLRSMASVLDPTCERPVVQSRRPTQPRAHSFVHHDDSFQPAPHLWLHKVRCAQFLAKLIGDLRARFDGYHVRIRIPEDSNPRIRCSYIERGRCSAVSSSVAPCCHNVSCQDPNPHVRGRPLPSYSTGKPSGSQCCASRLRAAFERDASRGNDA